MNRLTAKYVLSLLLGLLSSIYVVAQDNNQQLAKEFVEIGDEIYFVQKAPEQAKEMYIQAAQFDPSNIKANYTTYYLEAHQGWRGIGIDARSDLEESWARERPRSKFFAYAVTDESGKTIRFFEAGGLSATEIDTRNLEMWKQQKRFEPREVEVPTITLDDLLDREGVSAIDFLSMDINGAEPVALAGFDIVRFAPDLVHVEAATHRQDELLAYFSQHGYERVEAFLPYDRVNWYFTPARPAEEPSATTP